MRAAAMKFREDYHYSASAVDVDALAAEARRRSAESGSIAWLDAWLEGELRRAPWAFAPLDARPDPAARYSLPFDPVYPRFLGQGPGGSYSHTGNNHHAYDFVMPVGTPIRAAREGLVARVVDGFTKGAPDRALASFSNVVIVLHADGTAAVYAHLAPGIPLTEGARVKRGQVIARSGQTGWAGVPHLHFMVVTNHPAGPQSVPIRFGQPGGLGFAPEVGAWAGAPPKPTIELALFADGVLVAPGTLSTGHEVRVEARPPGRPARDVTHDPRLQLVSMTPWNLEVVGTDRIVFRPMGQFARGWATGPDRNLAAVGVFFLNGAEREIGLGKLEFRLAKRAPNAPR